MCNLKLENTVTFDFQLATGQSQYYLSNIRRLADKKIVAIVFIDPTDVASSSQGLNMASLDCVGGTYLTLQDVKSQKLVLDTFPVKNMILNVNNPTPTELKPQIFDLDKSYISIPKAATVTANNGKVITAVLYFQDNC